MIRRLWLFRFVALMYCAILLVSYSETLAQAPKIMVVIVRHAEKDVQNNPENPPLTAKGKKRAQDLIIAVEQFLVREQAVPVKHIVVTEFARTRETAEPLAKKLNLQPLVIPASDKTLLLKTIKESTASMLVVGHSNTIPAIIHQLTGETIPEIDDKEYNKIFIVTIEGRKKTLALEYYGSR